MLTGSLSSSGAYINPAVGYQSSRLSQFSKYKLNGAFPLRKQNSLLGTNG